MIDYSKRLRTAERHLHKACPRLSEWIRTSGKCSLEPMWDREPFEALVRAIAHQQLHGKAAQSILKRLTDKFPKQSFPEPEQLLRLRKPTFRKCGFSEAKTEAIYGVARGARDGVIPKRAAANELSDEVLIETLTQFRGIGQWTVEMFLIFSLGRLDVMPVDDFGVRAGLMHLYELESMPKKKDFAAFTDTWKPFRSIGAWYLWRLADAKKGS